MKIKFAALLAAASLVLAVPVPAEASGAVWLSGHVQNTGWVDAAPSHTVQDGWTVGTTGRGLRLEALRLNDPAGSVFSATAHVQDMGWIEPHADSQGRTVVGTTGRGLRLEAVALTPYAPELRTVWCQAHVQNIGWMEPVANGATCGTTGRGLRLEAVRIWVTDAQ